MFNQKPTGPSTEEIVAAIKALSASQEEKGWTRHIPSMIVAVMLALLFWFGSTVFNLTTAVTTLSVNVNQMAKTMTDYQGVQAGSAKTIGDLQERTAREDARISAVEQDGLRTKERIRILEGQKPLSSVPGYDSR